jgi:hypothetical protein
MFWLMVFWSRAISAGPVVLHRTDEASARTSVSDVAGVDPSLLSVTHFDAFRASMAPKWSGIGSLTACDGESVQLAVVADQVASAESSLMYMELDPANEALSQARKNLLCLDAPADPSVAARIGFLQGVISTEQKDKAKAWEYFSQAARFDPNLAWDEQYPTDGAALLKVAKGELLSSVPIEVGLTPSVESEKGEEATIFLNASPVLGADRTLSVPVGSNLLQLKSEEGMVGYMLEVEPESRPQLFLPQLLAADTLAQVTSEKGQKELSRVIKSSFEPDTPVYVVHENGVWRTASGWGNWETLREPSKSVVARAAGGAGSSPMAWVSAGLTAGALTGTVLALMRAVNAGTGVSSAATDFNRAAANGDLDAATTAYKQDVSMRNTRTAGFVGVGLGAALTTTGVIFTVPMFR